MTWWVLIRLFKEQIAFLNSRRDALELYTVPVHVDAFCRRTLAAGDPQRFMIAQVDNTEAAGTSRPSLVGTSEERIEAPSLAE